MVVAVMGEDIEAGECIGFFGLADIPCQRRGDAENGIVVEDRAAVVGMDRSAETMHVDAGFAITVESLGTEISVLFRAKEMRFLRRDARRARHEAIGKFDRTDIFRILGGRELDHPMRVSAAIFAGHE